MCFPSFLISCTIILNKTRILKLLCLQNLISFTISRRNNWFWILKIYFSWTPPCFIFYWNMGECFPSNGCKWSAKYIFWFLIRYMSRITRYSRIFKKYLIGVFHCLIASTIKIISCPKIKCINIYWLLHLHL